MKNETFASFMDSLKAITRSATAAQLEQIHKLFASAKKTDLIRCEDIVKYERNTSKDE